MTKWKRWFRAHRGARRSRSFFVFEQLRVSRTCNERRMFRYARTIVQDQWEINVCLATLIIFRIVFDLAVDRSAIPRRISLWTTRKKKVVRYASRASWLHGTMVVFVFFFFFSLFFFFFSLFLHDSRSIRRFLENTLARRYRFLLCVIINILSLFLSFFLPHSLSFSLFLSHCLPLFHTDYTFYSKLISFNHRTNVRT